MSEFSPDHSHDIVSNGTRNGAGSPPAVLILAAVLGLSLCLGAGWVMQDRKGLLTVQAPPQTRISVDGQAVANPMLIQLKPGSHQIELKLADGRTLRRFIEARAGGSDLILLGPDGQIQQQKVK